MGVAVSSSSEGAWRSPLRRKKEQDHKEHHDHLPHAESAECTVHPSNKPQVQIEFVAHPRDDGTFWVVLDRFLDLLPLALSRLEELEAKVEELESVTASAAPFRSQLRAEGK